MIPLVQRLPAYVALPACALGGAALKYLLIQVNQLAVNRLGLWSLDYHHGFTSHKEFQGRFIQMLAKLEEEYSIPERSRAGVGFWVGTLAAACHEIIYRFFLERHALPRILPLPLQPYAWLLPSALSGAKACLVRPCDSHPRAFMLHQCCLHVVCSVAQRYLGLPGAICTKVGSLLYDAHYCTNFFLDHGTEIVEMNPLDLFHWRTARLFFYVLYTTLESVSALPLCGVGLCLAFGREVLTAPAAPLGNLSLPPVQHLIAYASLPTLRYIREALTALAASRGNLSLPSVQRLLAYASLPACAASGAALRYILIQVNQLAVEKLGWDLIDYHDEFGSHEKLQNHYCEGVTRQCGNKYSIPRASHAGVLFWTTVLLTASREILLHFLLFKRVLPSLLPPSLSRYVWLLPAIDAATSALFPDWPYRLRRAWRIHQCVLLLISAAVGRCLGPLGATFLRTGFVWYDLQYFAGPLMSWKEIRKMHPIYLIHWKTLSLFLSLFFQACIPSPIALLGRAIYGRHAAPSTN